MIVKNLNGQHRHIEDIFFWKLADELDYERVDDERDNIDKLEEKVDALTRVVGKLIGMLNLSEDDLGTFIGYEWSKK